MRCAKKARQGIKLEKPRTDQSHARTATPGQSPGNRGTQPKQERQGRKGAKRDPLLKINQQAGTSHRVAETVKEEVDDSFLAVAASERTQLALDA